MRDKAHCTSRTLPLQLPLYHTRAVIGRDGLGGSAPPLIHLIGDATVEPLEQRCAR
jgi:hypothetical protein